MSAEDIEYMDDYKEFPTKESALDWLDTYLSFNERNNLIRTLQQEPRWIPVSERLPKEQGLYLVTIKSGDKYYIDTDLYNTLYKKGFRTPNVIAWMPLPLPWKGE